MKFTERAHLLSEKGTNRRDFMKRSISKYEWVDKGSSHIMSDFNAFVLSKNLMEEPKVTSHRASLSVRYACNLRHLNICIGPNLHEGISQNGHLIYLLLPDRKLRLEFMDFMYSSDIHTASHYLNLAKSPYAKRHLQEFHLPNTDSLEARLCRLPLHFYMTSDDVDEICQVIEDWVLRTLK